MYVGMCAGMSSHKRQFTTSRERGKVGFSSVVDDREPMSNLTQDACVKFEAGHLCQKSQRELHVKFDAHFPVSNATNLTSISFLYMNFV